MANRESPFATPDPPRITRDSFPSARKIYVPGSEPSIRVPMREVLESPSESDPPGRSAPLALYDTSGPYTDPALDIDVRAISGGVAR